MIGAFKPCAQKYYTSVFQKYMIVSAHPASIRGAFGQSSPTWSAGCDGRGGITGRVKPKRTAKSRGPDPPTLGSSLPISSAGDGGYQARHTGENAYKP
jgi:hypothetical protein